MIVSSRIAVLPVWRSPMISSRWPRPIGIMASMALKSLSRALMTSVMSCDPMLNSALPSRLRTSLDEDLAPELVQPGRHAGVGEPVSHLQDQAAEDGRVDPGLQPNVLLETPGEVPAERLPVGLGERDGGRDGRPDPAGGVVGERLVALDDLIDPLHPVARDEQAHQVQAFRPEA